MIVLEWLFLTIAPCDAAEPWQLGFQDAATPMMQGIIDLHHDIFFFLILILVFLSWILGRDPAFATLFRLFFSMFLLRLLPTNKSRSKFWGGALYFSFE